MIAAKQTYPLSCLLAMAGVLCSLDLGQARAEPDPEVVTAIVDADQAAPADASESSRAVSAGFIAPFEIQCRAARASSIGNMLSGEQAAVEVPRRGHRGGDAHAACVRRTMLGLASQEARNRDAGSALLLYWSLAEAIHSQPAMQEAIRAADAAVADHATVSRRGLELPIDGMALVARRLGLEDNRIALETTIETLTESLQLAADLPHVGIDTARPGADESSIQDVLDVDGLVAEALSARPELRMLRMLQSNLDADTAPVARMALAQVSPALGGSDSVKRGGLAWRCLHGHEESDHEVRSVARELRQWRQFREAAVAEEVTRAARECRGNAERIATARVRLNNSERALADLRAKQSTDGSDAFSIHAAEIEVAAAKRVVVERSAAWERSRVSLWQAQGILARQCGYGGR